MERGRPVLVLLRENKVKRRELHTVNIWRAKCVRWGKVKGICNDNDMQVDINS